MEAAQEYKKEIQDRLQFVMKERDLVVDQLQLEEKRTQKCLAQLKEEEENVRSAFDKMQSFLMEKKVRWLSQLGELEREIERRQEQNEARYSAEISSFNNLVAEMEMKCQQPATQLLKDIRSTLNRCQKKRAKQLVPFSPEVEERLGSFCTLISVHKKALEMCEDAMGSSGEWPPISRSDPVSDSPRDGLTKVVITLDPDTSGPHLILSDDLKSVTWGQRRQNVTVNSTRFDSMPCVLGQEKFNSGRYWWEVTLEGKDKEMITQERWALGVATESVQRKGWFNLNPSEGVWAIGKSSSPPCQALAFTFPETTALILSQEPRKIQVSLDYEEGRIEFFEAGTKELIFAFCSASFSGKSVHPFFLVWTEVRLKC